MTQIVNPNFKLDNIKKLENWFDDKVFILKLDGKLYMANAKTEGGFEGLCEIVLAGHSIIDVYKDGSRHFFLAKSTAKDVQNRYSYKVVEFLKAENQDLGAYFKASFMSLPVTMSPYFPQHGVHVERKGLYAMFFGTNLVSTKYSVYDIGDSDEVLSRKLRFVSPASFEGVAAVDNKFSTQEYVNAKNDSLPFDFQPGSSVYVETDSSVGPSFNFGGYSIRGLAQQLRAGV